MSPRLNINLNEVINDVISSIGDADRIKRCNRRRSNSACHSIINEEAEVTNISNEEIKVEVNNNINEHDSHNRSNGDEQVNRTPAVGMYLASGEEFTRFCHMYVFEKMFVFV